MKSVEFCYWLQGLFELSNPQELNLHQTTLVKQHLAMVFKHEIDPSYGKVEAQAVLSAIHNAGKTPVHPPMGHGHAHSGDVLLRC